MSNTSGVNTESAPTARHLWEVTVRDRGVDGLILNVIGEAPDAVLATVGARTRAKAQAMVEPEVVALRYLGDLTFCVQHGKTPPVPVDRN